MKRTVEVVTTRTYEIDILDERLTKEAIEHFESYMFSLDDDGDELEDKVNALFKNAAYQLSKDVSFVEGIGRAETVYGSKLMEYAPPVIYKEVDEYSTMEII